MRASVSQSVAHALRASFSDVAPCRSRAASRRFGFEREGRGFELSLCTALCRSLNNVPDHVAPRCAALRDPGLWAENAVFGRSARSANSMSAARRNEAWLVDGLLR